MIKPIEIALVLACVGCVWGNVLPYKPKVYKDAKEFCVQSLKIKTMPNGAVDKNHASFKCFNYCFQKRVGIIDDHANPIMAKIPSNTNSSEVVAACVKQNKETENCAKATWMRQCIKTGMVNKFDAQLAVLNDQCSKETNTHVSDYKTMKEQALVNINNKDYNCFHRCVFIKMQIMDEANNFMVSHIDAMVKDIGITGVDEIIGSCTTKNVQTDKCEQAVKRYICIGTNGIMKYTFSDQKLKNDADLMY